MRERTNESVLCDPTEVLGHISFGRLGMRERESKQMHWNEKEKVRQRARKRNIGKVQ